MRAAVYTEFHGDIVVRSVPKPSAPPGGVLVAVKATGVCRSDWHGWSGHDGDIADHGLPFVPGHELAGVVAEVGSGVTTFAVGDRVAIPFILSCGMCGYCARGKPTVCSAQEQPGFTRWGSFAEFVSIPRAERNVTALPAAVSFMSAAALGCRTTTAFRAVMTQGALKAGETMAVFGCGGVGLSAILIGARVAGARVVAVDVSAAALAKATELGAAATVNVGAFGDNAEARRAAVRAVCNGGEGADVTVDAAGFAATCEDSVWCARRGGRAVQVGLPLGEGVAPQIPMARVAAWELTLVGSHGIGPENFREVLALVERRVFDPACLVTSEVTLAEGAAAIMAMDHGSPVGVTMVTSGFA